ncbi:MAG: hypothetical protein PVF56_11975 [Desulfobacterales bacterium]|jgi:hypothetical protein
MRLKYCLYISILPVLICSQGCATWGSRQFVAESGRPSEYQRFFDELDKVVDEADVRNASVFSISGFPYLRVNRFLASFKDQLTSDPQKEQWIRWMQRLDLEARKKEISNLPSKHFKNLSTRFGEPLDRDSLYHRVTIYSDQVLKHDQGHPRFIPSLQNAIVIPDEYSTLMRVIGIYPLTSLPVTVVTHSVYDDIAAWHQLPRNELETLGKLRGYGPSHPTPYSQDRIRAILKRSQQNPLGIPLPSESEGQILLSTFAPLLFQDVAADYDEIGEVVWQDDRVAVNSGLPTVYYYFSHARFKTNPVLQINYSVWYAARQGPNSPWIERGPLDGLTIRISLDSEGRPFMLDIMNNCGCYHLFVPPKNRIQRVLPSPLAIDAFIPRWMPESFPQHRLSLRINSGWHQVDNIATARTISEFIPYRMKPYDELEMLPHGDAAHASIFNSSGIAKNTGRIEPLIFFPMGIPEVGSMRQRGHHAIKLVGRAYFDDPDLFNQNFEFEK